MPFLMTKCKQKVGLHVVFLLLKWLQDPPQHPLQQHKHHYVDEFKEGWPLKLYSASLLPSTTKGGKHNHVSIVHYNMDTSSKPPIELKWSKNKFWSYKDFKSLKMEKNWERFAKVIIDGLMIDDRQLYPKLGCEKQFCKLVYWAHSSRCSYGQK
jgi:hypothetical protein